jgi:hypothetical protein
MRYESCKFGVSNQGYFTCSTKYFFAVSGGMWLKAVCILCKQLITKCNVMSKSFQNLVIYNSSEVKDEN